MYTDNCYNLWCKIPKNYTTTLEKILKNHDSNMDILWCIWRDPVDRFSSALLTDIEFFILHNQKITAKNMEKFITIDKVKKLLKNGYHLLPQNLCVFNNIQSRELKGYKHIRIFNSIHSFANNVLPSIKDIPKLNSIPDEIKMIAKKQIDSTLMSNRTFKKQLQFLYKKDSEIWKMLANKTFIDVPLTFLSKY